MGATIGAAFQSDAVAKALTELDGLGITGRGSATWLRGFERVASRRTAPDFVWSGPEVAGLHARDTRRVYEELLGSATRSAWVSTYAFFDGPRAFDVPARRMDETPGLTVTLLLNVQRKRGDTTDADHLVRRFADRFWAKEWTGSARPRVFYDPRSLDPDGGAGVLHAKAVVVDDEAVFVRSANLTAAALDRNIEIGLLVRDRNLAATVTRHIHDAYRTFTTASRAGIAETTESSSHLVVRGRPRYVPGHRTNNTYDVKKRARAVSFLPNDSRPS